MKSDYLFNAKSKFIIFFFQSEIFREIYLTRNKNNGKQKHINGESSERP